MKVGEIQRLLYDVALTKAAVDNKLDQMHVTIEEKESQIPILTSQVEEVDAFLNDRTSLEADDGSRDKEGSISYGNSDEEGSDIGF